MQGGTVAALLGAVVLLAAAPGAWAQAIDEGVNAGGFEGRVSGSVTDLGPPPNTPVDDVDVGYEDTTTDARVGPVDSVKICTVDELLLEDATGVDIVPCEIERNVNATAPCESAVSNVEAVPGAGEPAADQVRSGSQQADAAIDENTENPPSDLPGDGQDALQSLEWNSKSERLITRCQTETQPVRSAAGVNESQLIVDLGIEITVCPFPALIPVCQPVSLHNTTESTINGTKVPIATNQCTMRNLIVDCGNVTILNLIDRNPTAQINQVLRERGELVNVTVDSDNHLGIDTPHVGETAAVLHTGSAQCTIGGIPPNNGVLPGAVDGSASLAYTGADLPLNLQEPISAALDQGSSEANDALDLASDTYQDNANAAVGAFNDAWQHPFLEDNVHSNDDGHPSNTGCSQFEPADAEITSTPDTPSPDGGE